ncbi:MAG: amylosucrase, partial [Chloroflexota bacterium]|nr:amylosucrase [Chloroflexota bacterium]
EVVLSPSTPDSGWLVEQARLSLKRLTPHLARLFASVASSDLTADEATFFTRLEAHIEPIFAALYELYGDQYDFFYHLEAILTAAAEAYITRAADLKQLDISREAQPDWFQSEVMVGGVAYVDLFAGDLGGVRASLPYFQELGLTYLHLMPLFKTPAKNNDGGYAVSSFREVNPNLGTMRELADLTRVFRANGMSLVLDFVFNHTSDDHDWAKRALTGDAEYQAYYLMYDDRVLPDQYEPRLREIFPDQAPGSFTYRHDINKWVWTTFYRFQWDLNYSNPAVFCAMLREMLFLANQGVEVLRLDAVPFIWKQIGTTCENLPQAHTIIKAYNALVQVAAPALTFKSEAIVHPRDVRSYITPDECPVSYNPIMMVSLWDALATRDVRFMTHTLSKQFPLPPNTAWINYIRSHDDIGWGFADEDAAEIGINGFDHRYFLNMFYTGRFPGSFATGLPFNFNPKTQDMRIAGTAASLAGLEQAQKKDDAQLREFAIRRIIMLYTIVFSAGGIPLIYLGDELGTVNDYGYRVNPDKAADNRWVHRPYTDATHMGNRHDLTTIEGRIFQTLRERIFIRKRTPTLRDGETTFFHTGSWHVFGFTRHRKIMVLANFYEYAQTVDLKPLVSAELYAPVSVLIDLLTGDDYKPDAALTLESYQIVWLERRG